MWAHGVEYDSVSGSGCQGWRQRAVDPRDLQGLSSCCFNSSRNTRKQRGTLGGYKRGSGRGPTTC